MNEKKLVYITIANNYYEVREVEENSYCCRRLTPTEVSDLLNKQQAIIQKEKGEKINAEEKLSYMVWKYNKLKQKNFDLQVKLSEEVENDE